MTCSLVIVDDHTLFRQGIRNLLETSASLTVVGEAADIAEAKSVIQATRPQIVLLDVILRTGTGFELLEQLDEATKASLRVILLTMNSEPYLQGKSHVFPCVKSYMLKDDVFEELLDAIAIVAKGGSYMRDKLDPAENDMPMLSPREEQIMLHTAKGNSMAEIAAALFISVKTVEKHRSNLFLKLKIRNAVELTRIAIRIGLIRP